QILEKVYAEGGQWQKLVQLLETKLTFTPETDVRRGIYLRLAEAYGEHLGAGDMAFGAIARAFNENRADLDLLEALEASAQKVGSCQKLVQIQVVDLDAVPDLHLRMTLLRKLVAICRAMLGDSNSDITYLNHALQYEPNDKSSLEVMDAVLAA